MKVKIDYEFEDETIKDLLCSAFEGGSNHWYEIRGYLNPDKIKVEYEFLDLPFIPGCGVYIGDIEEPLTEPVLLNRAAMERGLQVMADKNPRHMKDLLDDNADADTGDVFLQCCIWGEVIFG